ncbi:putative nucleic acid-binding Zn-ribbon protein [Rhodopirellula rubra]|uniref:Putative nucleic acid-binding Zn-ribbon protein n=1 Tax=Aporhodopirellula rubra TaxID=980271 RepID=A0A7W5DVB2_9BACT|nr:hypothetical protein [Aporhodopirellula rubra]MBB3205166.1 putative nucleic acid-binding Zn-ribbon protein [Aporhodopirellula rubra]
MTDTNNQPGRRRRSPIHADILNSPVLQLQRSLAAQQALLKPVATIPDLSAALTPASVKIFQDVQKMVAVQKTIRSELADTAFALRTAQNRVLAEVQTMAAANAAISRHFRETVEATSMVRQALSGNILSEIRSALAVRASFASQVRDTLKAATEARKLVRDNVLSSVRAAIAARDSISRQVRETVEAASTFRTQVLPTLQAVTTRLNTLRLDKLIQMAEDLPAGDALPVEWSEGQSDALAAQLESDIAAHPDADEWTVEEQINYLIDWTQRQDNAQSRQHMISLLINLIASTIFWLSINVVPNLLSHSHENSPRIQIIIRDVREHIEQQPLPTNDRAELRIVSRRSAPVKATRRRRSMRIANLVAGDVVRVCEKRGKSVHVEWTDLESGLSREGWMMSKHLVPMKKHR